MACTASSSGRSATVSECEGHGEDIARLSIAVRYGVRIRSTEYKFPRYLHSYECVGEVYVHDGIHSEILWEERGGFKAEREWRSYCSSGHVD